MQRAWEELWLEIQEVMGSLQAEGKIKHTLNRLELGWFFHGTDSYPCVTKVVKAAEMRDFVPVLAVICERKANEGLKLEEEGPYADLPQRRAWIMKSLARWYEICKHEGMFLSPRAAEELEDCCYKCCLFYSQLTKEAQTLGLRRFSQVPKFHFFENLTAQGKL